MHIYDTAAFLCCVEDLIDTPEVQSMEYLPQHGRISCLGHSVFVSYLSYCVCRFLRWDARSAARGGLLHDLFLYDWRDHGHEGLHAFSHPRIALMNAERLCALTDRERDIILTHMWPVTPTQFYGCRESMVVSCIDKLCAVAEAFHVFHWTRLAFHLGINERAYLTHKAKNALAQERDMASEPKQ